MVESAGTYLDQEGASEIERSVFLCSWKFCVFLDAIASPRSYPCEWVSQWVSQSKFQISRRWLSHLPSLRVFSLWFSFSSRHISLRCYLLIIQTSIIVMMRLQFAIAIKLPSSMVLFQYITRIVSSIIQLTPQWHKLLKEQLDVIKINLPFSFSASEYPLHFLRRVQQLKPYIHYISRAYSAAFCWLCKLPAVQLTPAMTESVQWSRGDFGIRSLWRYLIGGIKLCSIFSPLFHLIGRSLFSILIMLILSLKGLRYPRQD